MSMYIEHPIGKANQLSTMEYPIGKANQLSTMEYGCNRALVQLRSIQRNK
jgi:hypothetical protein